MMKSLLRKMRVDDGGVTIIEFAIICPTMLMLIMGLMDLTYQCYLQAVLNGAMQKASRDGTIEGNATTDAGTAMDNAVKGVIGRITKSTTWDTPIRKNYSHFADVGPEYFWDTNGNGSYDPGECFLDTNNNGIWDSDPGATGQGGANSIVYYQMGFTYSRLFPVYKIIGWPSSIHLVSRTILKNQPYKTSNAPDSPKVCK